MLKMMLIKMYSLTQKRKQESEKIRLMLIALFVTIWPVAQAPYGNHNGTVEAWQ